ncbi:MAG: hypothetical protein H7840_08670 [Alphaproteobacteria bacterium]
MTRVGLDLDNTIVGYDHLFVEVAAERGWLDGPVGDKRRVRDAVRRRHDGETLWQEVQAEVYAYRMDRAVPMAGVGDFLDRCRERGVPVFVVSHKTVHAARDPGRVDLRRQAMAWMEARGWFAGAAPVLDPARVFFEATREAKVDRIAGLDLTHFVDDLEEVFRVGHFPRPVARILFAPGEDGRPGDWRVARSWDEVSRAVFGPGSEETR